MALQAEASSMEKPLLSQAEASTAKPDKKVIGVQVFNLVVSVSVSAAYIWFSKQVPSTCNTGLSTYFYLMGVLGLASAAACVCLLFATVKALSMMEHLELAEKDKREGKLLEAEAEAKQSAVATAEAAGTAACGTCIVCITGPVQFVVWVIGLYQALKADSALCGNAKEVFWALLGIGLVLSCLSQAFPLQSSSGKASVAAEVPVLTVKV